MTSQAAFASKFGQILIIYDKIVIPDHIFKLKNVFKYKHLHTNGNFEVSFLQSTFQVNNLIEFFSSAITHRIHLDQI